MKLNVKDKLIQKGLNKNKFAKLTQLGYPAACRIYDGETTRISFDTLESICLVLECTPNDILVSDKVALQQRLIRYRDAIDSINNSKKDDGE